MVRAWRTIFFLNLFCAAINLGLVMSSGSPFNALAYIFNLIAAAGAFSGWRVEYVESIKTELRGSFYG